MAVPTPGLRASGTIRTSRFIKISGDWAAAEADANEDAIGISFQDAKYAPLNDLVTTNNHAENGDEVRYYTEGEVCLLTYGGTITAGQRIKSDADGQGVAATAAGDLARAIAIDGGVSGEKHMVKVIRETLHA